MIIQFYFNNGYAGCDQEDVFYYDNDTPLYIIDEDCRDWGFNNADSYSYIHFGWGGDYTDEEYEDYLTECCNFDWRRITWEEYVEYCENWSMTPNEEWRDK